MWNGFDPDSELSCPVTIARADPMLAVFTPDDADGTRLRTRIARIHEVPGASHTVHASPTLGAYLNLLQDSSATHDLRDRQHHEMGVRAGHGGKDRGVDNPQHVDPSHPAGRVNHAVIARAHPSRSTDVFRVARDGEAQAATSSSLALPDGNSSPSRSIGAAALIACTSPDD